MNRHFCTFVGFCSFDLGLLLNLPASHAQDQFPPKVEDFSESTLVISAAKYLGTTAESMAEIMDRVFSQYGIPDAIIRGEEVSAAVVFGLRYGRGTLEMRSGVQHPIYWRGRQPVWTRAAMLRKASHLSMAFKMLKKFTAALVG